MTCIWSQREDDYSDYYETECGQSFTLLDGTPPENFMRFCCYCGQALETKILADTEEK